MSNCFLFFLGGGEDPVSRLRCDDVCMYGILRLFSSSWGGGISTLFFFCYRFNSVIFLFFFISLFFIFYFLFFGGGGEWVLGYSLDRRRFKLSNIFLRVPTCPYRYLKSLTPPPIFFLFTHSKWVF